MSAPTLNASGLAVGGFAGFDTAIYPGDAAMAWLLANTNLRWVNIYLAPAPSHQDESWMAAYPHLKAAGWGFKFTYVGRQITGPGARVPVDPGAAMAVGKQDGVAAVELMAKLGVAPGSVLTHDIENGPPLTDPMKSYVIGLAQAVEGGAYCYEPYCSHLIAAELHEVLNAFAGIEDASAWVWKVRTTNAGLVEAPFSEADPIGSGAPFAEAWQYAQNAIIRAGVVNLTVDLNTATSADPSAP